MSGPNQGGYIVTLNNETMGAFTSAADTVDYEYLLYAAHDLEDGVEHYFSLTSADENSLAFDMAWVRSSLAFGG